MSFLDWFKKRKKNEEEVYENVMASEELKNPASIKHHVVSLCEQMIDISRELETVRREYDQVTAYLNDIQIVEDMGGEQKAQLIEVATNVSKLSKTRNDYLNAERKISDATFQQMQEEEDEMPDIIKRLKSNEACLDSIKRDMNALSGEKVEWSVLRHERAEELNRLKSVSYFMMWVFGIAAIAVVGLTIWMKWDTFLPIIIVAFLATLCGSYVVIRIGECRKDIQRCDVNRNHATSLENRVKIKYVNMKNAVDYTCEKYHVNNSRELTYHYEQYIELTKEMAKLQETSEDLAYFTNKLIRTLGGLQLYDSKVWGNYADAIVNPREMVELKHDLFTRRQKLRDNINYNINALEEIKEEVDLYCDLMDDEKIQIREILHRIEEINMGL